MEKKTLVMGASLKPERYSNRAVRLLRRFGHPTEAFGLREGTIDDVKIHTRLTPFEDIHTVTLYLGPQNQSGYTDYIKSLKPQRVIFNPGTENPAFADELRQQGTEVVENCTLVMLNYEMF